MKGIFFVLYYLLVFAVVVLSFSLYFASRGLGSLHMYTVSSGSMSPTIPKGSYVITRKMDEYKIMDVITFYRNSSLEGNDLSTITHRIRGKNDLNGISFFITKGDANELPDLCCINQKGIVGKVVFSIPILGFFVDFAETDFGFMLLISLPITFIFYVEIRKIFRNQS